MPVTQKDVARLAGVSVSTVSRALSGDQSRPVAAETQERIWEAVRRLNYEPANSGERHVEEVSERVARHYSVGLVLGNVSYKFSDPFWSPVLEGVDEELVRQQYRLLFAYTMDDLKHSRQRQLVSPDHVDGLILPGGMRPFGKAIPRARTVVIEGGDDRLRRAPELEVDVVTMEKFRSVLRLIEHLVGLGRRRLAFLGPEPDRDERGEAFLFGLVRYGIPSRPELYVPCPWSAEDAYPVAEELFRRHGGSVDALVCACDTIAIGAMRAAKKLGIRVPNDVAVTGFDDIPFARDLDPPLTTVRVPKRLMGELAARRLIERINEPGLPPVVLMVPTTLIARRSCGEE